MNFEFNDNFECLCYTEMNRFFINQVPRVCVSNTKEQRVKYRPEYDLKVIGNNLRRLREAKNLR